MKHKTLTFRFLDMSRGGFARLFLLLLLPCLSVIGVKAADSNGGVKNSILVSAIRSGRLIHVQMISMPILQNVVWQPSKMEKSAIQVLVRTSSTMFLVLLLNP